MRSNSSLPRSLELRSRPAIQIRVLIASPHPVVRIGLRAVLEKSRDMLVVAEASSVLEVLPLVEAQKPDVLLMDMELPGLTGFALIKQLNGRQATVQVLGFGAASAPELHDLLQSGAAGFIAKGEAPEMISAAVRGIACGEGEWLSRGAAAQLIRMLANQREAKTRLTERQLEVLGLVAAGYTNQQIGRVLGISVKTVEKHMSELMAKMRVASRVEMAVQAIRKEWVSMAALSAREPAALSI